MDPSRPSIPASSGSRAARTCCSRVSTPASTPVASSPGNGALGVAAFSAGDHHLWGGYNLPASHFQAPGRFLQDVGAEIARQALEGVRQPGGGPPVPLAPGGAKGGTEARLIGAEAPQELEVEPWSRSTRARPAWRSIPGSSGQALTGGAPRRCSGRRRAQRGTRWALACQGLMGALALVKMPMARRQRQQSLPVSLPWSQPPKLQPRPKPQYQPPPMRSQSEPKPRPRARQGTAAGRAGLIHRAMVLSICSTLMGLGM